MLSVLSRIGENAVARRIQRNFTQTELVRRTPMESSSNRGLRDDGSVRLRVCHHLRLLAAGPSGPVPSVC